jgi:hypothetical protein
VVSTSPKSVRLRAYRVGFGDCMLLTVGYGGGTPDAHVLVDFGTKSAAKNGPTMPQVAQQIVADCGGHLNAVVATHRHLDHIGGFGNQAVMKVLGAVKPDLVVRPWTDIPSGAPPDHVDLGPSSLGFVDLLDKVGKRSDEVARAFAGTRSTLGLAALGAAELGVSNPAALKTLDTWGPGEATAWVKAGTTLDLGLPGVSIKVLGPPTLEQVPGLQHYASSSSEYWLGLTAEDRIQDDLAPVPHPSHDVDQVTEPNGMGSAAWLVEKLAKSSNQQVLGIVEGFEQVLNNTSVILLVTVGRRSLLLSGDAQVENWSYTLDRVLADQEPDLELRKALANVDIYKVGHHGSRNASPKRLYQLWVDERRAGHPLTSVLSTKKDVFPGSTAATRVPQGDLVTGLGQVGVVRSTDDLADGIAWFDVEAPAQGANAPFVYTPGPPLA